MFRKKFTVRLCAVMAFVAASFLTGCHTDFTENAVERARTYALKRTKRLTEAQRHYIRYTQPRIYENVIFTAEQPVVEVLEHLQIDDTKYYPTAPHLDTMHSCIVWTPPDLGASVVVVGEGERSMRLWNPLKVIIKYYVPPDEAYDEAWRLATEYAMNEMPYLMNAEINRIRFAEPKIVYTKFNMRHGTPPKELSEWEAYVGTLREEKNWTQISLVWNADAADNVIVITGFSETGTLAKWTVKNAEVMSNKKLADNTLTNEEIDRIPKASATDKTILKPVETPDRRRVQENKMQLNDILKRE